VLKIAKEGLKLPEGERGPYFREQSRILASMIDPGNNLGLYEQIVNDRGNNFSDKYIQSRIKMLEDIPNESLDTAEADRAWKYLAAMGELNQTEFAPKTLRHFAGVTQDDALRHEALGRMVYNAEDSPFSDANARKERKEFEDLEISTMNFHDIKDRLEQVGEETPSAMGLSGWAARSVNEVKSAAANFATMTFTNKEGKKERLFDPSTLDMDSYDWDDISFESAGMKANIFQAAIVYAGAIGLGEGRALSDKDLQLAINTVGGSTNSLGQLKSRLKETSRALVGNLENTAKVRSRRTGNIGTYYEGWKWAREPREPTSEVIRPDDIPEAEWAVMPPEDRALFQ